MKINRHKYDVLIVNSLTLMQIRSMSGIWIFSAWQIKHYRERLGIQSQGRFFFMVGESRKRKIPALREAFILHLLADPEMCATRAYKKAGYKVKNDQVAASSAHNLLRISYIAEAVEKEKARRAKRLDASTDKTLKKLMRGQEFDIRRLYKEDPNEPGRMIMKHPTELDDDTAAAVVGYKIDKDGFPEYKIIDVKGCTQLVGDHLGMFRQKVELTGKDGAPLREFNEIELANRILSLVAKAKKRKTEASK